MQTARLQSPGLNPQAASWLTYLPLACVKLAEDSSQGEDGGQANVVLPRQNLDQWMESSSS